MKQKRILIVDSDQKNLKILQSNFEEALFNVDKATTDTEAIEKIQSQYFDVVLSELHTPGIDGYQLLKEVQRDSALQHTSVIFLTPKSDVWNRVKSFKLGAKDYIVKPMHVREILARVNMIINRIESRLLNKNFNAKKFAGRLEDLSVIDLIEILGLEKKTGILSLYNENGHNGQIFFDKGRVINAIVLSFRAEEAIYKILNWTKGRFSMSFCEIDVEDEVIISNMGLLLQGAKRMDLRTELLKQLPSLDAIIITTSNFKRILSQKEMNQELKEFMALFDGERSLGRIIDECRENEIVTLKRVVKLYKLGFLHVLRDFAKENKATKTIEQEDDFSDILNEESFDQVDDDISFSNDDDFSLSPQEAPQKPMDKSLKMESLPEKNEKDDNNYSFEKVSFEEHIISEQKSEVPLHEAKPSGEVKKRKSLLIIGGDFQQRQKLVRNISSGKAASAKVGQTKNSDVFYGSVELRGGNVLNIISFDIEQELSSIIDYFYKSTIGFFFILDSKRVNWNYYSYLLRVLRQKINVPAYILLVDHPEPNETEKQTIKRKLGIGPDQNVRIISEILENNPRKLLFTLLKDYEQNIMISNQQDKQ